MTISTVDLSQLKSCTKCTDLCTSRQQVVGWDWVMKEDTLTTMMCVLRNPGRTEDARGVPAIGRAGGLMRNLLSTVPCNLYITNMVKCFSEDNRPPTPTELMNCRPYIDQELEVVNPGIIVLFGKEAQAMGFKDFSSERSKVRVDGNGTVWTSTYHPSYALRAGDSAKGVIARDIWAAVEVWKDIHITD